MSAKSFVGYPYDAKDVANILNDAISWPDIFKPIPAAELYTDQTPSMFDSKDKYTPLQEYKDKLQVLSGFFAGYKHIMSTELARIEFETKGNWLQKQALMFKESYFSHIHRAIEREHPEYPSTQETNVLSPALLSFWCIWSDALKRFVESASVQSLCSKDLYDSLDEQHRTSSEYVSSNQLPGPFPDHSWDEDENIPEEPGARVDMLHKLWGQLISFKFLIMQLGALDTTDDEKLRGALFKTVQEMVTKLVTIRKKILLLQKEAPATEFDPEPVSESQKFTKRYLVALEGVRSQFHALMDPPIIRDDDGQATTQCPPWGVKIVAGNKKPQKKLRARIATLRTPETLEPGANVFGILRQEMAKGGELSFQVGELDIISQVYIELLLLYEYSSLNGRDGGSPESDPVHKDIVENHAIPLLERLCEILDHHRDYYKGLKVNLGLTSDQLHNHSLLLLQVGHSAVNTWEEVYRKYFLYPVNQNTAIHDHKVEATHAYDRLQRIIPRLANKKVELSTGPMQITSEERSKILPGMEEKLSAVQTLLADFTPKDDTLAKSFKTLEDLRKHEGTLKWMEKLAGIFQTWLENLSGSSKYDLESLQPCTTEDDKQASEVAKYANKQLSAFGDRLVQGLSYMKDHATSIPVEDWSRDNNPMLPSWVTADIINSHSNVTKALDKYIPMFEEIQREYKSFDWYREPSAEDTPQPENMEAGDDKLQLE